MLKKIKKRYFVLAGILLLVIILLVVRNKNQDNYTTYTVTTTTVSDTLLLAGTIDAKDRVDLGFATSGRIKQVNFNVGDTVKKGQVIAEIEQNRLSADLTQAQANYTLTRVDTSTDVSSAESSLETIIAEQNAIVNGLYSEYLSGDLQAYNSNDRDRSVASPIVSGVYNGSMTGNYSLDVYGSGANSGYSFRYSGLESGTQSATVNESSSLGTLGLFIQFTDGNSYSNTDWVIPVPNTRSATYLTRKRAYESSLATRDRIINEAENNINRVSGVDTDSQVSRDEALRAQARAQVNAVAGQLGDGKIRAPFDGIIARNDLEVGEIVNAFSPVIVMFSGQEKELNLNTPEIYINKIALGDNVQVTLDAYSDIIFDGTVEFIDFIDTEVNGVPVYKTDIIIDTTDERIRSGMNAKAEIISEQKQGVVAIPLHYISTKDDGTQFVLLSNGNHEEAEERIVETGLRGNEGLVEITSGLNDGDIIVLEKK